MTPREYCEQKIQSLRRHAHSPHDKADLQVMSVLSFFAQTDRTDQQFIADLKHMAESAEHGGRPALAGAALSILADWDTSIRMPA